MISDLVGKGLPMYLPKWIYIMGRTRKIYKKKRKKTRI